MRTTSNNNNRMITKTLMMTQQNHYRSSQEEDDDLGDEINDKLSELWTGMKNKRKAMLRNLTPGHSRRSQRTLSSINTNSATTNIQMNSTTNMSNMQANTKHSINISHNHNSLTEGVVNHQMINIKEKLSSSKIKAEKNKNLYQSQSREVNKIQQLVKDLALNGNNKQLLGQLKNYLQQTQLQEQDQQKIVGNNYNNQNQQLTSHQETVDGRTANFYPNNKHHSYQKQYNSTHITNQVKRAQKSKKNPQTNKRKSGSKQNGQNNNKKSLSKRQSSSVKDKYHPNKENLQNDNNFHNQFNSHSHSQSHSHQQSHITYPSQQTLPSIQVHRLIQLLKSTAQYRQFAYYYDSHELSYLKRLQQQHKKNCSINLSQKEKQYWAPTELIQRMATKNIKNNWGLNEQQLEQIIGEMKTYFQQNEQLKLKQQRQHYVKKIQKLKRQKQNNIPYDFIRLSNAKQRQKELERKKNDNSNMAKIMRQ